MGFSCRRNRKRRRTETFQATSILNLNLQYSRIPSSFHIYPTDGDHSPTMNRTWTALNVALPAVVLLLAGISMSFSADVISFYTVRDPCDHLLRLFS